MADSQQPSSRVISPDFFIPDNTEDFMAEVEEMMRFHAQIATRVEVVAAGIRKGLANPDNVPRAWARLDLRANAARVGRPLAHVAALETAASKSWGQAWRLYTRLYTAQPASRQRGWKV